jgi:hypothetical protein
MRLAFHAVTLCIVLFNIAGLDVHIFHRNKRNSIPVAVKEAVSEPSLDRTHDFDDHDALAIRVRYCSLCIVGKAVVMRRNSNASNPRRTRLVNSFQVSADEIDQVFREFCPIRPPSDEEDLCKGSPVKHQVPKSSQQGARFCNRWECGCTRFTTPAEMEEISNQHAFEGH